MSNTIEIMLEALKSTVAIFEGLGYPVMPSTRDAIAAGEAELKRRQDAITAVEFWISCNTDKQDAYCSLLTLLKE